MPDTQNITPQFDFLRAYIEKLLDDNGFSEVGMETRRQYVPQFISEAERRIGLAVMPKLTPETAKELVDLVDSAPSSLDMGAFWKKAVPEFENIVEETLQAFAKEFKKTLGAIQSEE